MDAQLSGTRASAQQEHKHSSWFAVRLWWIGNIFINANAGT
jgi:hypothetical protein